MGVVGNVLGLGEADALDEVRAEALLEAIEELRRHLGCKRAGAGETLVELRSAGEEDRHHRGDRLRLGGGGQAKKETEGQGSAEDPKSCESTLRAAAGRPSEPIPLRFDEGGDDMAKHIQASALVRGKAMSECDATSKRRQLSSTRTYCRH